MMRRVLPTLCLLAVLLTALLSSGSLTSAAQGQDAATVVTSDTDNTASATANWSGSSLMFIENVGQFDGNALFQVRGARGGSMWLAEDAIWATVLEATPEEGSPLESRVFREMDAVPQPRKAVNLKLSFTGANPHPRIVPLARLQTRVSFLTGNDPAKWQADVPAWGGVRYVNLYPGIDLELTGEQGQVAPRLVARPGADLSVVRLRVEGAEAVTSDGNLLRLTTAAGDASWPLLRAEGSNAEATVQPLGPQSFEVAASFVSPEQHKRPIAIGQLLSTVSHQSSAIGYSLSPEDNPDDLLYGTFLGGSDSDRGSGITMDGSGAVYVTGSTYSSDLPATPGAFDPILNANGDAFVAKLSPDGSTLMYATFLGGSEYDFGNSIAVDGSGAAYITGSTYSSNFPTTLGAFDTSYNGYMDAFVTKLSPDGSMLMYATFLGGSTTWWDVGVGIAVDGNGAAYVEGYTGSYDFPTTPGAFDPTLNGGDDAFLAKLNAAGSDLVYSTFLGGSGFDTGSHIAVDGSGVVYATGYTQSSDFPTTPGASDTSHNGNGDAFVAKLNAAGSDLVYSTFLGGSDDDRGNGITADTDGTAYITGSTLSPDFPTTPDAFDRSYNGGGEYGGDAFVAKLNADGSALVNATFLGGSDNDSGVGIAVDGTGATYVAGSTYSSDFPTTPAAFDRNHNGGSDAFVVKLNTDGSALVNATFLGGSDNDWGGGIAVDGSSAAYVTGSTLSPDFPTTPDAFDSSYNGSGEYGGDAFVAKLTMAATYSISGRVTDAGDQGIRGVTISAGLGGSAVTDASGNYVITDVLSGTYTLTPIPICYSFDPITRTVDVPPDATGQDFRGEPVECFGVYLPLVMRNQ